MGSRYCDERYTIINIPINFNKLETFDLKNIKNLKILKL